MRRRAMAVGLAFFMGTAIPGTAWAQSRGGGRQQSSMDTFWQWTNEQIQQGRNALSRWQGQTQRYGSDSRADGMDSPMPSDRGAVVQPGITPSTGYGQGSGRPSGDWGMSSGSGRSTPYGGMGTMVGRGRGYGRGQGLASGLASGSGRSGQIQPTPMNQGQGLGLPGMAGTAMGQGRGPCGQGLGKATSGRGRGGRRRQ
jgi:hypothetical protein